MGVLRAARAALCVSLSLNLNLNLNLNLSLRLSSIPAHPSLRLSLSYMRSTPQDVRLPYVRSSRAAYVHTYHTL